MLFDLLLLLLAVSVISGAGFLIEDLRFKERRVGGPSQLNAGNAEPVKSRNSTRQAGRPLSLEFDAGIYRNENYSMVVWRDRTFDLTPEEALAVQILHEASMTLNPDVRETYLMARLQHSNLSTASDLTDVFWRCPAWNTLVVPGSRQGFYRMALP